jgi:hypothetical protein
MANTFSFEDALRPAPQPQQPQTFSFEEATTPTAPTTFSFEDAIGGAPKEAPGFTGSFASALKERIETAAPAAKLFFGVGDQAKSTEELLAARQKAAEEYKQTEFSDIGEAFRQGNYGDALSKTYDKFKEVAGTSFGAMAPAMGAGAAAAFAAPAAVPAALAGTAAYGITALGSYIADNIARQKEEQKARGKEGEDINRLTASAAATGQTALDIFGFKFFKPLGQLVGLEGKAAADRAAMEIVESATRPGAYRRAVATGAAKGIAFEVPQEVSQQLLERWQAGLEVNPFTDPSAAKEYLEAAGGALLLGGPMGATSRVLQTRAAKKLVGDERELEDQARQVEEEIAASTAGTGATVTPTTPSAEPLFTFDTPEAAQERTRLLRLNRPNEDFAIQEMEDGTFGIFQIPVDTTGAADVTAPISEAGGAGAAMPSPAGVGEDATGAGVPVDGGLDAAGVATGIPDVGAGVQPTALISSEEINLRDQFRNTYAQYQEFETQLAGLEDQLSQVGVNTWKLAEDLTSTGTKLQQAEALQNLDPAAAAAIGEQQIATLLAETKLTDYESRLVSSEISSLIDSYIDIKERMAALDSEMEPMLQRLEALDIQGAPSETTVTPPADAVLSATPDTTVGEAEPAVSPTPAETLETPPAAAPTEVITEEPSVAETTETVEAKEERPQQAAPAATELETATNEAAESAVTATVNRKDVGAQQEQMRRNKALTTAVNKAITALQKLATPITPEAMEAEGIKDERAIAVATAAETQRQAELRQAKSDLFMLSKRKDLTQPNGKPWKARQMAIDAVANFTPEERAEFEAAYAEKAAAEGVSVLKSTRLPIASVTAPDAAFEQMTDAQQALRYIINKGNAFEKLLAQRLLSAVKGVKFVVMGPNTKVPDVVANAMTDTTQGVYYQGVIYVRNASFGDMQGINNTVVLHEALHAATSKKLDYALALTEKELDRDIPLQAFVTVMRRAMNRAESVYLKIKADGRSNPYLDGLYKNGAFSDIREFVSYGLTDKVMQAFLANIPGDVKGTSFFTKFVQGIRKLFNMAEQYQSALQDLIVSTDAVLSMKLPPDANAIITTPAEVQAAKKAGKEGKQKADKIKQPLSAPEEALTSVGQLISIRGWDDFKSVVSDIYNGTKDQLRPTLLGALTTRQLTELDAAKAMTDADGKPLLDNVIRLAEDMDGAKTEMLDETAQMAKEWHQWQQANPGKQRTLNRLIHLTTINQVDPSVSPNKSATLTQMYESLGPDGKALYNKIRDFYKARFLRYKQILVDRISTTAVDDETRAKLLAKLEDDFKNLPEPYFPLVREGKYWVRIGNPRSPNMEYYMFEDARERNFFVRQRAKELGMSLEELKADADQFGMGDNYMDAIDEGMRNSKMVKDIANLIDGAKFSLITTDEEAGKEKARLRDEVYQLYFSTLPEQNFRKHFLHRKGTAGFRADALRNFAKSSFHTSVQLAKIEYGDKIRKALDRAWDATKGMPQREYLYQPIYREMKDRIDAVLSPEPSNAFATRLANTLGTASFVYYMSAPASAITNLTGLAVFGMPVLNGEFGPRANLALAKNMNIFKSVGVTGKDGGYTFPTLLSKLTGHRQQAYMEALRRGKIDTTLTYDTLQLSRLPSDKYSGSTMTALNAISYLFHHSEKINREVMFMTAYDLAHDRAKKAKRDDKTAFEEAVNEASRLTDEAMFDYSEFNKPRLFRGNLARVVLQFKSFAQQTTFYLVKNFKEMFKGADAEVKKTAATKFIGTLGMTAMFAGTLGLPLVSVLVWAMSLLSEDDEDPEKRNPKLRFRNWLREEFGENLGLALERGPVSWATDVDFHSRVKLDQLWFRDIKQGKSEPEALKEFIFNLMGPSVGIAINTAEALRRINAGDVERGVEMLLPAGVRGLAASFRQQGLPFTSGQGEGVRTLKDDKVVERNQLNEWNRYTTIAGFSPAKVAATQEDASQARAELDKVNTERSQVLTMFKDLTNKFTPSRRDAAVRALKDFNKKNPMVALDAETIIKSIEDNIEASAMSVRGIRTTDKLRPMLMKILPPDPYGKK